MHSRVLQRGCAEFRAEHIIFHTKSLSEYKCYKSGFLNVLRYFCSVAHLLASSYTLRKVLALIFSRHEIRTKINSTETTQSDSSLSVVGEKKKYESSSTSVAEYAQSNGRENPLKALPQI